MNIWVAGGSILLAAVAAIIAVLAKMAVKEIRHPQREVQLSFPAAPKTDKDRERDLQHV